MDKRFTSFLEEVVDIKVGDSLFTVAATGITIGGMLGSLAGGYISDKFFNSNRAPVVGIFFAIQAIVLIAMGFIGRNPAIAVTCTTLIASCLFGTLTLIIGSASAGKLLTI